MFFFKLTVNDSKNYNLWISKFEYYFKNHIRERKQSIVVKYKIYSRNLVQLRCRIHFHPFKKTTKLKLHFQSFKKTTNLKLSSFESIPTNCNLKPIQNQIWKQLLNLSKWWNFSQLFFHFNLNFQIIQLRLNHMTGNVSWLVTMFTPCCQPNQTGSNV